MKICLESMLRMLCLYKLYSCKYEVDLCFAWKLTRDNCTKLQLLVFEDFGIYRNKPKNIVNYVKQRRKKEKKKKILLVDGGPISEKLKWATKNLHYVTVLPSSVSCTF